MADLLTDWQFLEAEAEAQVFHLVKLFEDVLLAIPTYHPKQHILSLLHNALRQKIDFVSRHPTALFQHMWNTCWWYDCPEAAKHYEPPEGGWKKRPPWRRSGELLHMLLESCARGNGERYLVSAGSNPCDHHGARLGDPFEGVLRGREGIVTSVALSSDGQAMNQGGNGARLESVAFSPDGAESSPLVVEATSFRTSV